MAQALQTGIAFRGKEFEKLIKNATGRAMGRAARALAKKVKEKAPGLDHKFIHKFKSEKFKTKYGTTRAAGFNKKLIQGKSFKRKSDGMTRGLVRTQSGYGGLIEKGVSHHGLHGGPIPARPYILPTVLANAEMVRGILKEEARKELRG